MKKEKIIKLYVEEKLSLNAIAKKAGCSFTKIRNILIKEGVPMRKQGMIPLDLPVDEIRNAEGSLRAIGKRYNISRQTVLNIKKGVRDA